MRRRLIVMAIVVVVIPMLSLGGYAVAHSLDSPGSVARTPTVAAFCQSHTSPAGFWSGDGRGPFLKAAGDAARWSHRQFQAVAGTLCAMLRRLAAGHRVLVADPGAPTKAPRPIYRSQVLSALRELERLPDAS